MKTLKKSLALLDSRTSEVKSEIISNRLKIDSVEKEVQSVRQEIATLEQKIDARFLQVDANFLKIDSRFEDMIVILHKIQANSDEQNARNKVVMDC